MVTQPHTPGPWTMQTVRTSTGVCFKVGPFPWKGDQINHACIYADYPNTEGHAICEANARLIAAAPDLLSELINMTARFKAAIVQGGTDPEFAEHAVAKARALIAKALGQSGGTK